MGKIGKILKKGPVEGQTTEVYPVTSTKAVYDENNKRLDNIITGLQESVYLNTPIPISTEDTPEAHVQNVKNIADYIEKAKAAGIADVTGMGVTCLIDEDYSAVGYLYGIIFIGITLYDDNRLFYAYINESGRYDKIAIITENTTNQVTSEMLDKGARRPIILPTDITEVDEETYQKLLSDDVDVLFRTNDGEFCTLTYEDANTDYLNLYFTCFSVEGETLDDIYIYAYRVEIEKNAPHTCTVYILKEAQTLSDEILSSNYIIQQSQLSPVLQEIDLTGTDADRKAKLDQFAVDWKALTGASDLKGARFVGYSGEPDNFIGIFTYNPLMGGYSAIATNDSLSPYQVGISPTGTIMSNSLFYHLEPVIIRTGNTDSDMAYNVAAIQKYVNNITLLGVYTYYGFTIPVYLTDNESCGYLICNEQHGGDDSYPLSGIVFYNGIAKIIVIDETGRYEEIVEIAGTNPLNTTSDNMVDAINEVNALAKGYSMIFTPIELTTETAQNKTAIDARVAAFTAQGISLTNGCCIPVTYKGVYAGNISLINGDWYGLLVKNTNNPADNINIKLSADGTITEGNSVQ